MNVRIRVRLTTDELNEDLIDGSAPFEVQSPWHHRLEGNGMWG